MSRPQTLSFLEMCPPAYIARGPCYMILYIWFNQLTWHTGTHICPYMPLLNKLRCANLLENACGEAKLLKSLVKNQPITVLPIKVRASIVFKQPLCLYLSLLPNWNLFWKLNLSVGRSHSPLINKMLSLSLQLHRRVFQVKGREKCYYWFFKRQKKNNQRVGTDIGTCFFVLLWAFI